MHAKASETMEMNVHRQGREEWIKIGNQLHDQAIFDFFARLLTGKLHSMKPKTKAIAAAGRVKWLRFKHISRVIPYLE